MQRILRSQGKDLSWELRNGEGIKIIGIITTYNLGYIRVYVYVLFKVKT